MTLPDNISSMVQLALREDIGDGDLTADLIAEDSQSEATVICREEAVLSGRAWFDEVFKQVDPSVKITWHFEDGDRIPANAIIVELQGPSRSLLSGERAALNFVQTLSATATQTNQYVTKIAGTNTRILDTRKTLPGFRLAQKYAVSCGGGKNHRIGLYDMILIKENHIMAAGSITKAIQNARQLHPGIKIEVETETFAEFEEACAADADIIMLDDFDLATMCKAVQNNPKNIPLEASGGVNLDTVLSIAETGVDLISVGEITKNIDAIDLSMRFKT
ncbi:carboxylating nicotinate-nucleotide diphosphorylase [Leucothrix pacifica]|uniref:Probable nicotinate-nucleotide pyrophosphorylase [carboxylating] n=1 Tax=Leucothrix pacifica TaxID=1247513 RepID=A0A317CTN4_9GAMM|nr:carboxylating nicotinate-nucleotide diphosphorylase [Leucothrix pacifica]PWQ99810.1 carboxylating nicotinate-nucleotide diphosphorylase [Leucothrix pacifica]